MKNYKIMVPVNGMFIFRLQAESEDVVKAYLKEHEKELTKTPYGILDMKFELMSIDDESEIQKDSSECSDSN